MGLKRATILKAVASAFKALGDIPEACTYRRTASVYNTATGVNTTTNTNYAITAIFTSYGQLEVDRVLVLTADVKCILQQSELALIPSPTKDKVVRSDGQIFNVIRFSSDPAKATYTIQLRAP